MKDESPRSCSSNLKEAGHMTTEVRAACVDPNALCQVHAAAVPYFPSAVLLAQSDPA
jgi:hypothetical protein